MRLVSPAERRADDDTQPTIRLAARSRVSLLKRSAREAGDLRPILRTACATRQSSFLLTLRGLKHDGLVNQTAVSTAPPQVGYALTPLGHSLRDPVAALGDWAGCAPRCDRECTSRIRRRTPGQNCQQRDRVKPSPSPLGILDQIGHRRSGADGRRPRGQVFGILAKGNARP